MLMYVRGVPSLSLATSHTRSARLCLCERNVCTVVAPGTTYRYLSWVITSISACLLVDACAAVTWLQTQALTATYRWLSSINLIRLAQLVALERGSVVVLPRASAWAQNEALLALLDEIRASVLVVQ